MIGSFHHKTKWFNTWIFILNDICSIQLKFCWICTLWLQCFLVDSYLTLFYFSWNFRSKFIPFLVMLLCPYNALTFSLGLCFCAILSVIHWILLHIGGLHPILLNVGSTLRHGLPITESYFVCGHSTVKNIGLKTVYHNYTIC